MSDDLPIVGRPRGSAWRQLQSEGILWEGQILVAGGETDLAALLIVTSERLSLVRGGAIALDIKHDWLSSPPTLRRTGAIDLQVHTPGQRSPEPLTFIVREGRLAAAELVDVLTPRERYEPEFPTWNSSMFLDEDPIIPARLAPRERKHSPAPVDPLPAFPIYATLEDDDFPSIAPPPDPMPDWSGAPRLTTGSSGESAANVIPRQNDWNLKPIDGMDGKDRRDRRAWIMRVAAIFLAVAGIATWQSGLVPDYATIRDRFADNTPEIHTIAQLPSGTPTQSTASEPSATPTSQNSVASTSTTVPTPSKGPSSTEERPTYSPAEQTALALGVGGEIEPTETATLPPVDKSTTNTAPIIEPPATTETPEPVAPSATSPADEPVATTASSTEPALSPTATMPSIIPKPSESAAATSGSLDFSITDLQIGTSLPALTLGPLRGEQWVVITLDITNQGTGATTLDLNEFVLTTTTGETYSVDSATGAVAKFLGLSEKFGTSSNLQIGPGERISIVLVFVPSASATDFTLRVGDVVLPLESGATAQSASNLPLAGDEQTATLLSTQLLTNDFEQFDILRATSTSNAKIAPRVDNPQESE